MVRIKGPTREAVEEARRLLEYTVRVLELPVAQLKFIVGRESSGIQKIRAESKVLRIDVNQVDGVDFAIVVTGLKRGADFAIALIQTQLAYFSEFHNKMDDVEATRSKLAEMKMGYGERQRSGPGARRRDDEDDEDEDEGEGHHGRGNGHGGYGGHGNVAYNNHPRGEHRGRGGHAGGGRAPEGYPGQGQQGQQGQGFRGGRGGSRGGAAGGGHGGHGQGQGQGQGQAAAAQGQPRGQPRQGRAQAQA